MIDIDIYPTVTRKKPRLEVTSLICIRHIACYPYMILV